MYTYRQGERGQISLPVQSLAGRLGGPALAPVPRVLLLEDHKAASPHIHHALHSSLRVTKDFLHFVHMQDYTFIILQQGAKEVPLSSLILTQM